MTCGDIFKKQGQEIRAKLKAELEGKEGVDSEKVSFVCCLINPLKPQPIRVNNEVKNGWQVVGYKFNISEPMKLPVAPLQSSNPIDVSGVTYEANPHPAGEIVLNLVETATFMSRVEFAGKFTGGDKPVVLRASFKKKDLENVTPNLKLLSPNGSIKEGAEEIATYTVEGSRHTNGVIKPEYAEKFGVLLEKRTGGRGKTAAPKKGESTANIAAAFRDMYAKKYGVQ
jgi:hypothetical protein